MKIDIFTFKEIRPFSALGLTHPFWTIHIDTLIWTWGAMLGLLIFVLVGRYYLYKENSKITTAYNELLGFFLTMCQESFAPFNLGFFTFVTSLFFFTCFCCFIGIIPFFDESTRDLNTTLALGLTSFVYVHYQKIKYHGIGNYLGEYIQPIFLLAPINVIGELAKIASMTFRLFGNVLGGSVILFLAAHLVQEYKFVFFPLAIIVILFDIALRHYPALKEKRILGWVIGTATLGVFFITLLQFYGVFEGLIQAFVLTMLTTTYLSMGTNKEEDSSTNHEGIS